MRRRAMLLTVFLVALILILPLAKVKMLREGGAGAAFQLTEGDGSVFARNFAGRIYLVEGKRPARDAPTDASFVPSGGNDNLTGGVDSLDNDSVGTLSGETAALGWHQEAHDAQHTGFADVYVPMPWKMAWQWNGSCGDGSDCRPGNPEQGWSFEVPPRSHLVAGGGRLYLPAGENGVWAINEWDGKTVWHNPSIESFCAAAFDPETNVLFVAAGDGSLYRLNPSNGAVIDSFQADSGLNLAPTIAAGSVYVVSDSGTLYAINKNTMESVWTYSAGSQGQTPAAYSESSDVLVFGTADLYLHAVNSSDGSRRWRVKPTVHDPPIYYYTHGWPVIADQHGIVLMRLRVQRADAFTAPEGWETYPDTNSAIRSYLISNPDRQCLFALNLDDGSTAFVPAVGPGGMERPDKEHSMGPQPVVKQYPNGDEVVYTVWRNRLNCIGYFEQHPQLNYDAGIGEMVLNDSTVPGYEAGDCRFVEFSTMHNYPITVDEMCFISVAGPTIMYSHFIALISYRITDRSDWLGHTRDSAIQAERQYTILNRIDSSGGCIRDTNTQFCSRGLQVLCDNKIYPGSGFWVFWDCIDPPWECASAYSGGMKPRYAIANNRTIYYELNGGTIFAVRSENDPGTAVDKQVRPVAPSNGDTITYTLNILGNGLPITLTDTLPDGLSDPGSIDTSLGAATYDSNQRLVTWNGTPDAGQSLMIRFPVTVQLDGPLALANTAVLIDSDGNTFTDMAMVIVDAYQCYFPLVMRSF